MRSAEPLHRVTIGRTREVRGPDGFERGAVGVIIAVAMTFAVWFGVRQMHMAAVTEAVTLASAPQYNEMVYRAVHGRWPSAGDEAIVAGNERGKFVHQARIGKGGVITMQVTLRQYPWTAIAAGLGVRGRTTGTLSFRPQVLGAPGGEAVTLLCGYAKPVAPVTTRVPAGHSTFDRHDLPPLCR